MLCIMCKKDNWHLGATVDNSMATVDISRSKEIDIASEMQARCFCWRITHLQIFYCSVSLPCDVIACDDITFHIIAAKNYLHIKKVNVYGMVPSKHYEQIESWATNSILVTAMPYDSQGRRDWMSRKLCVSKVYAYFQPCMCHESKKWPSLFSSMDHDHQRQFHASKLCQSLLNPLSHRMV